MPEGESYFQTNYVDYERQNSPAKLAFYRRLVLAHVAPGRSVFELGVGTGHFLQVLAQDYACGGCDVNAFGVATARQRVPQATVVEGSFERIPVDPPPDAVVSWDVLEHVPELDAALAAIHARLAPGGRLIGMVPVYDGPLGWLVRRLDHDPTHLWKEGRHDWRRRLERAGFTVLDWGGVIRRLIGGRYYLHLTRPRCLLRRVGSAMYFVAAKAPPAAP